MNDFQSASAEDCLKVITSMENSGLLRAQDRAVINNQFNGGRPFTDEEVEKFQIQVNANFLEGYRVLLDANLQVNGALLNKDRFFNARCLSGKVEHRDDLGRKFTDCIHKVIKKGRSGRRHMNLMKNRNASLTLHGIGAMVWMNSYDWMPRFAALEDLLIPTNSSHDLSEDLCHFGMNAQLTPYELLKLIKGNDIDPGWNVPFVRKIIKSISVLTPYTETIIDQPEKWESLIKQHGLVMDSDAVPKIKVTYFFFQGGKDGKWYRKILLRKSESVRVEEGDETFIYNSNAKPFADEIEQIIHVQFGDGNVVAPLKFHSVRGLGMLLYSVVELMNRLRCQFTQHVFEQLMTVFRIQNPGDRDRPKLIQLNPYSVLEEGVSFVSPQERNQADPKIVEFSMSQNKQLLGESSASYVQDVDTGTKKEQTLGEAKIKLQSANKIVGGMLANMYLQEYFYYEEIVRRFLQRVPTNKDVEKFQSLCEAAGIPKNFMTPNQWEIDVEQVSGMGDQTLAVDEVTSLMAIINQLDPSAQMIVRRKYIAVITRNSDLANTLVPEDPEKSTKGRKEAEDVFGTLMRGIPVSLREGIEQQDYIMAMSEMMAATVERINQTDGMGSPEDVMGLQTVAGDIDQHIQLLAQDPANKEFVTGIGKAVGKMMNDVKAFAQRQQQAAEAAAKEGQQDPAEMAKIQALQMQAQIKAEIASQQAEMKIAMKEAEHQQKMKQAEETHSVNMQAAVSRAQMEAQATAARSSSEVQASSSRTSSDIALQTAKTASDIENQRLKTEADVESSKKKAAAAAKQKPKNKID